jgi:two-component system invasion response regulator UvrY
MMNNPTELHVLLVEDSLATAERLWELIESTGYPVAISHVETEKEALARLYQSVPDIVVLDLRLKEGSGFNVLRKIAPLQPKPFVVVMTNYALPNFRDYALLAGADRFLDKSLEMEHLPKIIRSLGHRERVH